MELSVSQAKEKIAELKLEVERLRTALSLIYDVSQDLLTPAWQALEHRRNREACASGMIRH